VTDRGAKYTVPDKSELDRAAAADAPQRRCTPVTQRSSIYSADDNLLNVRTALYSVSVVLCGSGVPVFYSSVTGFRRGAKEMCRAAENGFLSG